MRPSTKQPTSRALRVGVQTLCLSALLAGCGPTQISPYNAREREYEIGEYEREPTPVSKREHIDGP